MLEDEDEEDEDEARNIRFFAKTALTSMGHAVPGEENNRLSDNDREGENSHYSDAQQPSNIAKDLNSRDRETLLTAIQAVQTMGPDAAKYAPVVASRLDSQYREVQYAALYALQVMGDAAAGQASKIEAQLIKNRDRQFRNAAASALGSMKSQAPLVAKLLKDDDYEVVYYALIALAKMGRDAAGQAAEIAELLESERIDHPVKEASEETELRVKAIEALGAMQEDGAEHASMIADLLDNKDGREREAAIEALGAMGKAVPEDTYKKVEPFLNHREWKIRQKALTAIGAMGVSSSGMTHKIAEMVSDYDEDVRNAAVAVLESKGRLIDTNDILLILSGQYIIPQFSEALTFYAHYFAGGDENKNTLIEWLTVDPGQTRPRQQGQELNIFLSAMTADGIHKEVREKIATCISDLTRKVKWKKSDQKILRQAEDKLRRANFADQADVVENKLEEIKRHQILDVWGKRLLGVIGIHALFWITLVGLYPKSLRVQSFFFWNPWGRRIFGFVYVGIILSYVPYFRAKLFAPFKESLISNAALDTFDDHIYFDKSNVRDAASGQRRPIKEAIKEIKYQIYLEGESGLGKTMFLRYLIRHSKRTVIYLRAENCYKGVIEAIQAILHGPAQDLNFLKSLIHTGAIDICIDGLNEVSPDTRAHITEFVQNYSKANIMIASQPLEWTPPSTLKTYILQPLDEEQIETFLLTRKQSLPSDASVTGKDFEGACRNYLSDILNDELPMDRVASAKRVLSNPIDLTLVALMLAYGEYPDLFHLMEQQYDLMNNDYKRLYNSDFPLTAFSETVFQMRLDDKIALYQKEYLNEIKSMEKHKMVLGRRIRDAQEKISTQWYFRHDKIMDYFIMCTFLGPNNIRLVKYIDDPRFRGVYFLLAILMPWEEAEALRERLIQYSATTKDHTVSDTFVQLLISRKAA
jgi:HEAT repeat protein